MAKDHLEALVEQRLELVDDSPEVATVEAAIDAVVYGVYGLTADEVGVVEGV
ncbi:MAG: hypothetical protein IPN44_01090 [Flavobacteriales bacterium]|nr:hypothetical protein [Flavobacteriales bacterium]